MLKDFESFIAEYNLFDRNNRVLVAISGGVDSVVLSDLMKRSGFTFSLAHCNFHLRGEESNRDEKFVREWAEKNNIELFVTEFDTDSYMKQKGISLEMAARELRYNWFDKLMDEYGFDRLATAHHSDDSTETFFINLIRGTGIAGLHGILPKTNRTVRPLLFATRERIADYAKRNDISFVEDSTNSQTKFMRNRIRLQLIPLLKELSPNFDNVIRKDIERLRDTEVVFREVVERVKTSLLEKDGMILRISIEKLKRLNPLRIFLYEILSEYGFNETNINDIANSLDESSGKQFFARDFRLVKDRECLIICPVNKTDEAEEYMIYENQTSMSYPIKMQIDLLKDLKFVSISKDRNVAMLDAGRLHFPLILRKWRKGDSFMPFGMKKEKKLSDFFTSNKYSLIDKENQWLLCSGDQIVWVVGRRIDDRYKINSETETILKIEVL